MDDPSLDEPAEGGFTLVEALVAIALTALLLSSLSAAIHLGLRVWKASDIIDRQAETLAGADFLRRTLMAAEPVRVRGKDGKLTSIFKGQSQRIEFVALMPEGALKAGAYKMIVHLVPETGASNGRTLEVKLYPRS
jgi:general secretion pathway protein J